MFSFSNMMLYIVDIIQIICNLKTYKAAKDMLYSSKETVIILKLNIETMADN